jgi:RNA polymerase sigma-70 factor (ECF subfamily)
MRTDASDLELVDALRRGRADALRILYDRYSGLVYSVAFRILNQTDEAEDVTQEVFLTFFKGNRFQPERAALGTFLALVTRSKALNKLRSRQTQQRYVDRLQTVAEVECLHPTPLEQVALQEQKQVLQQALTQLNETQRQVLELNFYQGLSHAEIASRLDLPLGTVKSSARQGLIKLRTLLGTAIAARR